MSRQRKPKNLAAPQADVSREKRRHVQRVMTLEVIEQPYKLCLVEYLDFLL